MNIGKNQFDKNVKETNAKTKKITDQLKDDYSDLFESIRTMKSGVCAGAPVNREQLNTINNTVDEKSRSEKYWKYFLGIIGDILHRRYLDQAQGTDRYQITEVDLMENCDAAVDVPVDVVVAPQAIVNLNMPSSVAVDNSRNLFIADTRNHVIRKLNVETGLITTIAGNGQAGFSGDGGPATSASLNLPTHVAVTSTGAIVIADRDNNRIRLVSTSGIITTIAGNGVEGYGGDGGPATSASLNLPTQVAVTSTGAIVISDFANHRIRLVSTSGIITTIAGNGNGRFGFREEGGPATSTSIIYPWGVSVTSTGAYLIAEYVNNRISLLSTSGMITTIAGNGAGAGMIGEGIFGGDDGPATAASLYLPTSIAVTSTGAYVIADSSNNRIRLVSTSGIITTIAGNGGRGFGGDGGPATSASLKEPTGVAVDAAGNIYIADTFNNRIRMIDRSGIIRTIAGPVPPPSGGRRRKARKTKKSKKSRKARKSRK